jgi:hypothetical protein
MGDRDDIRARLASFPWREWTEEVFGPGFEAIYRDLVRVSAKTQALDAWNPRDPFLSRFITDYVGERIVQLEGTTKEQVTRLIQRVLDEGAGLSTTELGTLVQETVRDHFADYARYRADRIARTETAIASNHGTVLGIAQGGGELVDVFDGTDDDECAAANGAVWTVEQALADPVAHPNCVRAFAPHLEE